MDFFNCNKTYNSKNFCAHRQRKNQIVRVDTTWVVSDSDAFSLLSAVDELYQAGQSYAIGDLDFVTKYTANEIAFKNPVYCGLVGFHSNHVAGASEGNDDLSMFGRMLVRVLTERNIMIDLRNLSERSFMGVVKESRFPSIVTDAGLSSLCGKDILKPYQEKTLVDTGGLIAVSLNKNQASLKDIALSIVEFMEKFGAKNLCLSLEDMKEKTIVKTLDMLCVYLMSYGATKDEVEDIFYLNAKSFMSQHFIDKIEGEKSFLRSAEVCE